MKKESQILIRVSPEEKEAFERAAEFSGLGLSAWVRQKLRGASEEELKKHGEKAAFIPAPPKNHI